MSESKMLSIKSRRQIEITALLVWLCFAAGQATGYAFSDDSSDDIPVLQSAASWQLSTTTAYFSSALPLPSGAFFVAGNNGECYSIANGIANWRFLADSGVYERPCLVGDRILFGTRNGTLYCLSLAGELIWSSALPPNAIQSAILGIVPNGDQGLVVQYQYGRLANYAIDGKLLWHVDLATVTNTRPALGAQGVVATCFDEVYFFTLDGDLLWKVRIAGLSSAPMIFRDHIFVGGRDCVYQLDLTQGQSQSHSLPGVGKVSALRDWENLGILCIHNKGMTLMNYDGQVIEEWTIPRICLKPPNVDKTGRVWVSSRAGSIHLIDADFTQQEVLTGLQVILDSPSINEQSELCIADFSGIVYGFCLDDVAH
ncbi:PQQ-binding-like beta-propeller repeat protein [bacterium]|nr:PQQ-binding-like beta-propeller repeat protein [bacterium]